LLEAGSPELFEKGTEKARQSVNFKNRKTEDIKQLEHCRENAKNI
jgi:hypothetical protein